MLIGDHVLLCQDCYVYVYIYVYVTSKSLTWCASSKRKTLAFEHVHQWSCHLKADDLSWLTNGDPLSWCWYHPGPRAHDSGCPIISRWDWMCHGLIRRHRTCDDIWSSMRRLVSLAMIWPPSVRLWNPRPMAISYVYYEYSWFSLTKSWRMVSNCSRYVWMTRIV